MNIELSACPIELQRKVTEWLGKVPGKVIAVRREEFAFGSGEIAQTRYRAYMQCGSEIGIFTQISWAGLDGADKVEVNVITATDIRVILEFGDVADMLR